MKRYTYDVVAVIGIVLAVACAVALAISRAHRHDEELQSQLDSREVLLPDGARVMRDSDGVCELRRRLIGE